MVDEPRQFHVVPLPTTFAEDLRFCAVIAARYACQSSPWQTPYPPVRRA
jgi:hypothetical protein